MLDKLEIGWISGEELAINYQTNFSSVPYNKVTGMISASNINYLIRLIYIHIHLIHMHIILLL